MNMKRMMETKEKVKNSRDNYQEIFKNLRLSE
jgi:hypothetical protein